MMNTVIWRILTLGLALLAISGWGATFWQKRLLRKKKARSSKGLTIQVEASEKMLDDVRQIAEEHFLNPALQKLLRVVKQYERREKMLRFRHEWNGILWPEDLLLAASAQLKSALKLRGKIDYPVMVRKFHNAVEHLRATYGADRREGNWGKYLAREKEVRGE